MSNVPSKPLTPTAATIAEDALNAMGDGFIELDAEFIIRKVNRLYESISTLNRKQSVGKNLWELFPDFKDPKYPYFEQYTQVMETKKPTHFELYDEMMDRWHEFDVYPRRRGGVLVFFRDVTARKQAELEAAKQHALINAITHNVSVGILMLDQNTRVVYMNQVAENMTGYTTKEAAGRSIHELIHHSHPDGTPFPEEECNNIQRKATRFNKTRKTVIEDIYFRKDGSPFTGIANVMKVETPEDGTMLVVDLRDTSSEKKLLSKVKQSEKRQAQLESITKTLKKQRQELIALNNAKDEFINLASHQLRTPATGVKQYLGMVLQGYTGEIGDEVRKFVSTAYDANDRQMQIIESLLRVARLDSGIIDLQLSNVNISKLAMDIVKEQAPLTIAHEMLILIENDGPDIRVAADANMLRMVIENLLDNARKYGRSGKWIHLRLYRTDSAAIIEVEDEGRGISRIDQSKLFKKFSRLDNNISIETPGTGLGLYWCKRIVETHQGTIAVNSDVGKGSTFMVSLPM